MVCENASRVKPLNINFSSSFSSDGELVLMDAGCEYHGYVSDVTRTWPVGGKFTPAQRDLYEVVRSAKEEVTEVSLCMCTL